MDCLISNSFYYLVLFVSFLQIQRAVEKITTDITTRICRDQHTFWPVCISYVSIIKRSGISLKKHSPGVITNGDTVYFSRRARK
jgi:hypothetical protein